MFLWAFLSMFLWSTRTVLAQTPSSTLNTILNKLCNEGRLDWALAKLQRHRDQPAALHSIAALEVILHSNITGGVALHRQAKSLSATTIPPLAQFHLSGKTCAGLGDLYYLTAVIIKQMVDSDIDPSAWQESLTTLITLTADSGLHHAAETHIQHALSLSPDNVPLLFRAALMTPGVFESQDHLLETRERLVERVRTLAAMSASQREREDMRERERSEGREVDEELSKDVLSLRSLDEFVLSPTFYFIYQGFNDKAYLETLQAAYATAYPAFIDSASLTEKLKERKQETTNHKKLFVGFVSSHFRRHSICKLFCGVATSLAPDQFEVFLFSSLSQSHEDEVTFRLREHAKNKSNSFHYVSIGKTFVQNRDEVIQRDIDVLIYLDIGMDPSTTAWAAARLAPVQMCIWGHPSTTGLPSIDYYLSSALFHSVPLHLADSAPHGHTQALLPYVDALERESNPSGQRDAQSFFSEQLVQFNSLGFVFSPQPSLFRVLFPDETDALREKKEMEFSRSLADRPATFYGALRDYLSRSGSPSPAQRALLELLDWKETKTNSTLQGTPASPEDEDDPLPFVPPSQSHQVLLCPQHLTKLHPALDRALLSLLLDDEHLVLAMLGAEKRTQWKLTLTARWQAVAEELLDEREGDARSEDEKKTRRAKANQLLRRIRWLPALSPEEFLVLLALGDLSLDPFPFGGGVTVWESLSVCTPVITLPSQQNVPQLATGILRSLELSPHLESLLVAQSESDLLYQVKELLHTQDIVRSEICARLWQDDVLRRQREKDTTKEWESFLQQSVKHQSLQ